LFVALDVFEKRPGAQGGVSLGCSQRQLAWLRKVFEQNADARFRCVMAHPPILTPVWKWHSSGLTLPGGHESALWKTMAEAGVDLYLCGEVHAVTCTLRDDILQIAHGGLWGYNPEVTYLVAEVRAGEMRLEIKALDTVLSGPRLWQVGNNRPHQSVTLSPSAEQAALRSLGTIRLVKSGGRKRFLNPTGCFAPGSAPPPGRATYEISALCPEAQTQQEAVQALRSRPAAVGP